MCLLIYHLEPKLSSNAVQIILVSTRMNVQLNIQISQGSVATNLREGGKFYSSFTYSLYRNTTVKELLQSANICQSYPKNITCTFFYGPRCTCKSELYHYFLHTLEYSVLRMLRIYHAHYFILFHDLIFNPIFVHL